MSSNRPQQTNRGHSRAAAIILLAVLIFSVATINLTPKRTEATLNFDLCGTFGIACPEPSPPPPSSASGKFFLALVLQYVNKDTQLNIYKPNMGSEDMTRLRVQNDDLLKPEYVQAALSLPGPAGVSFKSSDEIVQNAKRVKDLGFNLIEFNLEPQVSPDSDNNNVVGAYKKAAQAAHQEGLKFRATPSRAYTTQFGSQIAPFVDFYHVQAQSLQDNGIKAYSDYVHSMIPKLEKANSKLIISVQVSTEQGNAPGLSKLETLKQCVSSVMDVADGASVWFSGSKTATLKSFVEWYNNKYS